MKAEAGPISRRVPRPPTSRRDRLDEYLVHALPGLLRRLPDHVFVSLRDPEPDLVLRA
jgi:hypothetical protein